MTRIIFLGGFLGAGKTTTLLRLAHELVRSGKRVGILSNDQGQELVDTELFRSSGFETRDVRGGCFCCRLDDFVCEAGTLISTLQPDFLLAEPVGSCTDLVATVLRPLAHIQPRAFEVGPFAVLVDPVRAREVLSREGNATLSEKVTYIYRLQQMEADAIAINKLDMLRPHELAEVTALLRAQFPGKQILSFSARTGEGFEGFATWALGPDHAGLAPSPAIDYDTYAEGEAELAWFDGRFTISAAEPVDMDESLLALGAFLRTRISAADLEIAHVKMLLRAGDRISALSISRSGAPIELSRSTDARALMLELIVNARVAAHPEQLRAIVEMCLSSWAGTLRASVSKGPVASFSPSRPVPTRRMA
jgi:G3E family GTPase